MVRAATFFASFFRQGKKEGAVWARKPKSRVNNSLQNPCVALSDSSILNYSVEDREIKSSCSTYLLG